MTAGRYNDHVTQLSMPPIPAVQDWAGAYDEAYGPLIDLSQAVPGYPPHREMLDWLGEISGSIQSAGYGAIQGEAPLRAALAASMSADYGGVIGAEHIQITAGCNQAFIAAIIAIAGRGDTIALTNPCYFNHETSLAMLGIGTRYIPCHAENGFVPTIADIAASIGPQTRAIALVSPNNPTGAVYPEPHLSAIYDLCRSRGLWLVLDETYRDFLPLAQRRPHALFAEKDWQEGLIQLYSFSKSYCIPGHRLGAIAAGAQTITQIIKVMDNLQICAPRPAQLAVARAIDAHREWRLHNREIIADRAEVLKAVFGELPGWQIASIGAYFAFVRHPYDGKPSVQIARQLAAERGIVTIPGAFFGTGQERYLRVAFANASNATLHRLPERLRGA